MNTDVLNIKQTKKHQSNLILTFSCFGAFPGYLPLTWLASLAHYLQLGLVEAGQVWRPSTDSLCTTHGAKYLQWKGVSHAQYLHKDA